MPSEETIIRAMFVGSKWPPTAVYKAYDADGQILYVGIADCWGRRWYQHARTAPWYPFVTRLEIEWLDTRAEAIAREADLILSLAPHFNTVGKES